VRLAADAVARRRVVRPERPGRVTSRGACDQPVPSFERETVNESPAGPKAAAPRTDVFSAPY